MSEMRTNVVAWFEIPASDFGRAVAFYETLLDAKLRREEIGGNRMAVFPYQPPGVGGAVLEAKGVRAGGNGTLVYLNCDGKLDAAIARVQLAGGRLAGPRVELPGGMGSFVHVEDTEGNRVGLHSH
jgi:predicted enzyme related to lactoylglutathione lyase